MEYTATCKKKDKTITNWIKVKARTVFLNPDRAACCCQNCNCLPVTAASDDSSQSSAEGAPHLGVPSPNNVIPLWEVCCFSCTLPCLFPTGSRLVASRTAAYSGESGPELTCWVYWGMGYLTGSEAPSWALPRPRFQSGWLKGRQVLSVDSVVPFPFGIEVSLEKEAV